MGAVPVALLAVFTVVLAAGAMELSRHAVLISALGMVLLIFANDTTCRRGTWKRKGEGLSAHEQQRRGDEVNQVMMEVQKRPQSVCPAGWSKLPVPSGLPFDHVARFGFFDRMR